MAVATTNITFSDLRRYAFTTQVVRENTIDAVYSHTPAGAIFLAEDLGDFGGVPMTGAGKRVQSGGFNVHQRVRLGKHVGSKRMAGPNDTHSVDQDDNVQMSIQNWTHYSGAVVVSDYDIGVNRGEAAMASFLEDQTESVMLSLVDTIVQDMLSTSTIPNAITSLDDLIAANSTVQGLAGGTYAQWNARGLSARGTAAGSVSFTSGSFAAQGIADMRRLANNATEGSIQPDVYLTDYPTHERYEGSLQPQQRFQGAVRVADGSFMALGFRGKPVLADPNVASGYMYALRVNPRDGVHVTCLEGFDFTFDEFKKASNQEVAVQELRFKGQMGVGNRQYGSNKMTGITD